MGCFIYPTNIKKRRSLEHTSVNQKMYPSQMTILKISPLTQKYCFISLSLGHQVHWKIFHSSYIPQTWVTQNIVLCIKLTRAIYCCQKKGCRYSDRKFAATLLDIFLAFIRRLIHNLPQLCKLSYCGLVIKGTDYEVKLPGFKYQLYHLLGCVTLNKLIISVSQG